MDIGSAVGRRKNVVTDEELRETDEELREVPNWEHSRILGERERTAIEYAEEMSKTPVRVSDALFE